MTRTILVADDDRDIRELVAFKLEQSGFGVIEAEDGSSALAAAREHRPAPRVRADLSRGPVRSSPSGRR